MKKQSKDNMVNTLKALNLVLIVTLVAVTSIGCSSFSKRSSNDKRTATLVSPQGSILEIAANTPSVTEKSVQLPRVRLSNNKRLCKAKVSENAALKRHELDLELSFMINSLNNQKPLKSKKGVHFRKLTGNMIKNLRQVPDCEPYRYKLHVISKLVTGHDLERMDD